MRDVDIPSQHCKEAPEIGAPTDSWVGRGKLPNGSVHFLGIRKAGG
jgi:hypothetical protein